MEFWIYAVRGLAPWLSGDIQWPATANNCSPIANWLPSTGTQYTTRARERKFPSNDLTFKRSFGFQGLVVSTRAPRGLTFSVTPSWAGVRMSRLDRSTVTLMGVRSSARFNVSIGHREAIEPGELRVIGQRRAPGATTAASYSGPYGDGQGSQRKSFRRAPVRQRDKDIPRANGENVLNRRDANPTLYFSDSFPRQRAATELLDRRQVIL